MVVIGAVEAVVQEVDTVEKDMEVTRAMPMPNQHPPLQILRSFHLSVANESPAHLVPALLLFVHLGMNVI